MLHIFTLSLGLQKIHVISYQGIKSSYLSQIIFFTDTSLQYAQLHANYHVFKHNHGALIIQF